MLRIGSRAEYGVRIVLRLAGGPPGAFLCAGRIAAQESIPRDYVDQLLMRLRRAGLVRSRRGVDGGYALARAVRDISVGSVIRAVERDVFESVCGRYAAREAGCPRRAGCRMRPVWEELAVRVEGFLDGVSLARLSGPPGPRPAPGGRRAPKR